MQDTLKVGLTVPPPIQDCLENGMDTTRNLARLGKSKKRSKKTKKRRGQVLSENLELCNKREIEKSEVEDTRVKVDLSLPSSIQQCQVCRDIEISRSEMQDTRKVGLTVAPAIHDCLEMGMDTDRKLDGLSESQMKKLNRRLRMLGESLENCDKRGEIEVAKSEKEDTRLRVDLTMPSSIQECPGSREIEISESEMQDTMQVGLSVPPPIQDCLEAGMDTDRNLAGLSKRQMKRLRRRLRMLGGNLENCGKRGEIEVAKSDEEDTRLKVDLTMPLSIQECPVNKEVEISKSEMQETPKVGLPVPRPIQDCLEMGMDTAWNLAGLSKSKKKRLKRRLPKLGGNLENCDKRGEIEIAQSEVQDTLVKENLPVQSPILDCQPMDIATAKSISEKSEEPKKGKRSSKVNYEDEQKSIDQITVVLSLSLSDDYQEAGSDYELNKVQNTNQEFEFSAREGCRPNESREERLRFVKRVCSTKVKEHSQNANCMPLTNVAENDEKPKNELEQGIKKPYVHGEKATDKSQNEGKHPSSGVDAVKHDPVADVDRVDNVLRVSHLSPERTPVSRLRKKLLILDVNGLLADIVTPPTKGMQIRCKYLRTVFKRPFFDDFLRFCFERFDVGIWSSRSRKVLVRVVDYLLGDLKHKLLLFWDISHCTETKFKSLENQHKPIVFKELRKIWEKSAPNLPWEQGYYDESNTLLLDDSPYKALLNPKHTSIFPSSYSFQKMNDDSLGPGGDLRIYMENLASADNVKMYVQQHPFGQHGIDERSLHWAFYSKVVRSINCSFDRWRR